MVVYHIFYTSIIEVNSSIIVVVAAQAGRLMAGESLVEAI